MVATRKIVWSITALLLIQIAGCGGGGGGGGEPIPLPATVAVPDVTGLDQATAENNINSAGLSVGTITNQSSDTVPAGNVVSQDPLSTTMVTAGTAVDLVVSNGPANIVVPDVVGLSQARATTDIIAAGLVVGNVTRQNDSSVPVDDVISQDPVSATLVSAGTTINLVVSSGPATIAVPNVVGLSQAQATTNINAVGLLVGTVTQQNDNSVPVGNVISQDPVSATLVSAGAAVNLVISNGPATIVVPDVVGLSQAQAATNINALGLLVGTVTQQNDDNVPVGNVISQNPVAATMVNPGTAVDLTISQGPAAIGFSDEFNSDSLNDWSLRHIVEGTAAQYTTLDINQTTLGRLTIIPTLTPGWFDDGDAPLVFKMLTGNFAVHIRVLADSVANPGQAPGSQFNSAGIMARDPNGATGPENYIMLNTGRQGNSIPTGIGSETKTTVNSSSTLFLDQGSNSGELILCRLGDNFHSFRFLDGDTQWAQTNVFSRPDLPGTLQVGLIALAFNAPPTFNDPADIRAEFEFVRLRSTPAVVADCTP